MSPDYIRAEIAKETLMEFDFEYLSDNIYDFFKKVEQFSTHIMKLHFISFFIQNIKPKHLQNITNIGKNYISGIQIVNVFKQPIPNLGLVCHEALCDIIGLRDIKYPYEEHKALFLKKDGMEVANWGNGYLEITPHQDDLYEDLNCDLLALTYVKDSTDTPTNIFLAKDILAELSDAEIEALATSSAVFKSGKNVTGFKENVRKIVAQNINNGVDVNFDFRIDVNSGKRMLVQSKQTELALEKVFQNTTRKVSFQAIPKTGTFIAIANSKALHARSELKITKEDANMALNSDNPEAIPRLLYRSKGQLCKY